MIYWRKRAENCPNHFLKFFGRTQKSIQFGNLDRKSLFFVNQNGIKGVATNDDIMNLLPACHALKGPVEPKCSHTWSCR